MSEFEIPKVKSSLTGAVSSAQPTQSQQSEKSHITFHEPSFREKVKRSFVKEDINDIRDYVVFDVILPAVKKSIFDTVVGTVGQLLGIAVPKSFPPHLSSMGGYNANLTTHEKKFRDYNSISNLTTGTGTQERYNRFYAVDWPFDYEEQALSVLERLTDLCDTNGWVSVARFFEFADPGSTAAGKNPYTNEAYGWTSIAGTIVKPIPDYGYVLTLPAPKVRRR